MRTGYHQRGSSILFGCIGLVSLLVWSTIQTAQHFLVEKRPIDLAGDDLGIIALQANAIDQDMGQFIRTLDTLIKAYLQGENIFLTHTDVIDQLRRTIADGQTSISQWGFASYQELFGLLQDLYPYKDEVYQLLGQHDTRNYLALLQNTAEKRPNGGFFGSFAFAGIRHGFIQQLGVVDSYLPDYLAPNTTIPAPQRAHPLLHTPDIRFIAGNKFGFTSMDGKNIKQLYETIFNETYDQVKFQQSSYSPLEQTLVNKQIDGILFLSTDAFEIIAPGLTPLLIKRQFINANIDLIRGEDRSHKKEVYLKEVNQYFQQNSRQLVLSMIRNFATLQDRRLINLYLPDASPGLQDIIQQHKLTTTYDPTSIYIRDTNHSYNKIDRFVTKEISLYHQGQRVGGPWFNYDIIDDHTRTPGEYTLALDYQLHIPDSYRSTIYELQDIHQITMTDRELGILGLGPTYDGLYRANQITLHLPPSWNITDIQGKVGPIEQFRSPFSQVINTKAYMTQSSASSSLSIDFSIPQL